MNAINLEPNHTLLRDCLLLETEITEIFSSILGYSQKINPTILDKLYFNFENLTCSFEDLYATYFSRIEPLDPGEDYPNESSIQITSGLESQESYEEKLKEKWELFEKSGAVLESIEDILTKLLNFSEENYSNTSTDQTSKSISFIERLS